MNTTDARALLARLLGRIAPEVDLEDGEGEISKPLFSRVAEEPADELEAMDWESDEEEQAAASTRPGKGSSTRRKRGRRRVSTLPKHALSHPAHDFCLGARLCSGARWLLIRAPCPPSIFPVSATPSPSAARPRSAPSGRAP